ncbi:MAG TPA: type II toxin-antitoxin system death-on-curing family toxin [Rhizomicrobium sp.]|nr:type II toxin-antitoxin system death-on-curing family toxin [Rhizomicrobium sp.]
MKEPNWVEKEALLLLHLKSLARFGGAEGLRDEGLLDSALARPKNAFHYEEQVDIAALAAAYAYGLARNHPFVDGNKRMAFMAMGVFLTANGWWLEAGAVEAIQAMTALADGALDEGQLTAWLTRNIRHG